MQNKHLSPNSLDIDTLVDASSQGPVTLKRSGFPALVVMREEDYVALLRKASVPES